MKRTWVVEIRAAVGACLDVGDVVRQLRTGVGTALCFSLNDVILQAVAWVWVVLSLRICKDQDSFKGG